MSDIEHNASFVLKNSACFDVNPDELHHHLHAHRDAVGDGD